jgi:hypothetical protein
MTRARVFFPDKSNLRFEPKLLHQSQIPKCELLNLRQSERSLSYSKTLKTLCCCRSKWKLFGELFLFLSGHFTFDEMSRKLIGNNWCKRKKKKMDIKKCCFFLLSEVRGREGDLWKRMYRSVYNCVREFNCVRTIDRKSRRQIKDFIFAPVDKSVSMILNQTNIDTAKPRPWCSVINPISTGNCQKMNCSKFKDSEIARDRVSKFKIRKCRISFQRIKNSHLLHRNRIPFHHVSILCHFGALDPAPLLIYH